MKYFLKIDFANIYQECCGVKPDEVELGETSLVPDERSVDMINAADQVDPRMTDQAGDGGLSLAVPQHLTINVMDDEVEVAGDAGQDLLDVFTGGGEACLYLKNVFSDCG